MARKNGTWASHPGGWLAPKKQGGLSALSRPLLYHEIGFSIADRMSGGSR
jgi:hypothetical protein